MIINKHVFIIHKLLNNATTLIKQLFPLKKKYKLFYQKIIFLTGVCGYVSDSKFKAPNSSTAAHGYNVNQNKKLQDKKKLTSLVQSKQLKTTANQMKLRVLKISPSKIFVYLAQFNRSFIQPRPFLGRRIT